MDIRSLPQRWRSPQKAAAVLVPSFVPRDATVADEPYRVGLGDLEEFLAHSLYAASMHLKPGQEESENLVPFERIVQCITQKNARPRWRLLF